MSPLLVIQVVALQALAWGGPLPPPVVEQPTLPPAAPAAAAQEPPTRPAEPTKGEVELPEAVLTLRDGRVFTGFLIEKTDARFVLRIVGIDTPFEMKQVERYRILEPVMERYRTLRLAIADDDAEQILQLADFLVSRGRLEVAVQELEKLRLKVPRNREVAARLDLLRQQQDLDALAREPEDAGSAKAGEPRSTATLLSPELQNLVKVYELDLATSPPVIVGRSTSEAVLKKYASHPLVPTTREGREAMVRDGGLGMVDLMFRLRAREFYPQIKVEQTPEPLKVFREEVHKSLLLSGCSTSGCHGSVGAGRLVFATQRPLSEAAALTNFYILSKFRTDDGKLLLDMDAPERSLLLQLGMPREQSTRPHPFVPSAETGADQWRASVRNVQDRKFQQVVGWVKSLAKPRPSYGLDYLPVRPFEPMVDQAGKPAAPIGK